MSAATPAYGTTPAITLTLDGKGDSRLSWAATRLQQKLWLEENRKAHGVTTQRLVAYLRATGLAFFVLGGVTSLFALFAPITIAQNARWGLGAFGLVIAAIGLAQLVFQLGKFLGALKRLEFVVGLADHGFGYDDFDLPCLAFLASLAAPFEFCLDFM